jgi:hypothetical protein
MMPFRSNCGHRGASRVLVVLLAIAGCTPAEPPVPTDPVPAGPVPAEPVPAPTGAAPRRGFALPTYQTDGYDTVGAADHLAEIVAIGGTWVQLNPTWYQRDATANGFAAGPDSVSDAGVRRMIRLAHTAGLRVSVKPHVDLAGGGDRASILPADPDAWFGSYRAFVRHYADIAAREGAAEFVVGTELTGLSGDRPRWLDAIAEARARFPGTIGYAANYDEFERVSFWDAVDVIGVDAYFPLASGPTADTAALVRAWAPLRDRLAATAARHRRPVVFTEAGYRSQVGTVAEPYSFTLTTPADQREQAAAYEALLRVFAGQPWWSGVDWWVWTELPEESSAPEESYSPRGKLAARVLAEHWSGS